MPDKPVSEMTAEEVDRAVVVEVLGLTESEGVRDNPDVFCMIDSRVFIGGRHYHPSTSPTDDYAVLEHVRDKWGSAQDKHETWWAFKDALFEIWSSRPMEDSTSYQPGDYARAALQAVRESE